jgi:phosphoribosylformimino-5-aminoimidazole carboxamide ribonucleotide (ProFAR) isomerase
VGTATFQTGGINAEFLSELDRERLLVALDSKDGRIVVKGWREAVPFTAEQVLKQLEPYCSGFLCTYVDKEGMLQGTDLDWFRRLRSFTDLEITAAGGISTIDEIRELAKIRVHAALGMAIYKGTLDLCELSELNKSFRR